MPKIDSFIKLYLLIALRRGRRHGYELMKELEGKLGRRISAAHIYPFLKELRQHGLIRLGAKARGKVYSLTQKGSAFAAKTLHQFHDIIQESLRKKLTSCTHCGCEVYNNRYTEVIGGKKLAFCCCHCAASYKGGRHG